MNLIGSKMRIYVIQTAKNEKVHNIYILFSLIIIFLQSFCVPLCARKPIMRRNFLYNIGDEHACMTTFITISILLLTYFIQIRFGHSKARQDLRILQASLYKYVSIAFILVKLSESDCQLSDFFQCLSP